MTPAQAQLIADLRTILAGFDWEDDRQAITIRKAMGEIERLAARVEELEQEIESRDNTAWEKSEQ